MAKAKNKVISGDYKNFIICNSFGKISLAMGFKPGIEVSRNTVENYEVMDSTTKKSAASAVGRGLLGAMLVGPVGALAGLSAKEKGIHIIAIEFSDGKRSLLEVDEKIYKVLISALF